MSNSLKVICVGTAPELLESRRLVLQSAGYSTICVTVSEASQLLLTSSFDVMIISMSVIENDRICLRQAAGEGLRTVQLDGFTDPQKLLAHFASRRYPELDEQSFTNEFEWREGLRPRSRRVTASAALCRAGDEDAAIRS